MNDRFESLVTEIPGPRSRALRATIARYEARGVTFLADDYPVFWESAHGALVTDVDGNRYIDCTSAFGVANSGHTNPAVSAAIIEQAQRLIHGMGDVHPTEIKAQLLALLAEIAPGDLEKTFLCSSGHEAVEFARKTALLATGRAHAIAYHGAYHGLSLGTLGVGGIARFREPFAALVDDRTTWLPFPGARDDVDDAIAAARGALDADPAIGCLIIEPIQGRGGVIVPPDGFLPGLRALCTERDVILVFDEIYTGFARTGTFFACEREAVVPDLLCVGKAIAGGVPLSATIGRPVVMDAWRMSDGEALHTSTYLGNPLACAAAVANIAELRRPAIAAAVSAGEAILKARLTALEQYAGIIEARGRGMMWALEFVDAAGANRIVRRGLAMGVILLQSGVEGTSITFAPPLTIETAQLERAMDVVERLVKEHL